MRALRANHKTTICAALVILAVVLSKVFNFDAKEVALMASALGLIFAADARGGKTDG